MLWYLYEAVTTVRREYLRKGCPGIAVGDLTICDKGQSKRRRRLNWNSPKSVDACALLGMAFQCIRITYRADYGPLTISRG